jgi:HD-like signal output (HDOD) protein
VLWRHAFLTACLSRRLNQSLELGYQGEDFSAGLAHDLGRILIAIGVPHLFESADPMAFGDEADVLAHEQSILGTNHAEFGAWFCEQNKLPASLVTVVRFHHTPARAASHHNLVALVATADHMANYIQRLGGAEGFDPETNLHWRSFADRLASGMRQKIAQIAVRMMTETIQEADAANTLA